MRPLIVTLLCAFPALATPIADVPDPRPSHHVIDLTRTLTADDVAAIDRAADGAAAREALLVAVVPSTDGVPSRAWATQLYNRLRIDSAARNRGVLLVVALGDRHAEIVLGDGWPQSTRQVTDSIMNDVIVAKMKAGDVRAALVDGAAACAAMQPPPPQTWGEKVFIAVFVVVCLGGVIAVVLLFMRAVRALFRFAFPLRCPKCHARGFQSSRAMKARPTLTATGIDVVTEACAACGYSATREVVTPLVSATVATTTSGSSSSAGGSSSGGGSSGSW